MSLNLSLYDAFANIVPGFAYLSLIYQLSILLNLDLRYSGSASDFLLLIVLIVLAFILGHILNRISYTLWFSRFESYEKSRKIVKENLLKKNPEMCFEPDDAEILLAVIKHNNFQLSEKIESNRANGIMMRNLSFAFFLHAVMAVLFLVKDGLTAGYFIYLIITSLFCYLCVERTKDFIRWFYRDIFLEALNYGDNVSDTLKTSRKITSKIGVQQ